MMDPLKLRLVEEMMVFAGLMATLLAATAVSIVWVRGRKGALPSQATDALAEISERLGRLENAVDASAIEIERISEGQRFTSKLLAERGTTAR